MGGEASGCDETTTDVLIESALWDEINIAQSGRKLGINSDARYRFERGVDPAFMVPGLEMATKLVMELCGGTPSENVVVGRTFPDDRVIDFPLTETKRLAAIDVPLVEARRILGHLGFMVAGNGPTVEVAIPSWRTDVQGKADIVEELVRIVGVDKVPMTPFDRGDAPRKPVLTPLFSPRTRRATPSTGGARHGRSRHVVVYCQTTRRAVRRRQKRTNARQSNRDRFVRHAAEPAAGPHRHQHRPTPIAALPTSRCSKSVRCFEGDRPEDQFTSAAGIRHGFCFLGGAWTQLVRLGDGRCVRRQGRRLCRAFAAAGAPVAGVAGGARWRELVASRPLRHDSDRAAECARPFRRTASANAGAARRRRSGDRL